MPRNDIGQGLIDVGKKEFSTGLTFVCCSRVRSLKDLLFVPPFPFQRISNICHSRRHKERLCEDFRLQMMCTRETLTTTQVDLKQDSVINVAVSVEKNAATPNSSQQVEDLHIQRSSKCTTITLSEQADKGSTELANIPTEKAQSNDTDDLILVCTENNYQFKYHPVNKWLATETV